MPNKSATLSAPIRRKGPVVVDQHAVTHTGKPIPNPVRFLCETGLLFRFNVEELHPLGLNGVVSPTDHGDWEFRLLDNTDNPVVTFPPDQYRQGQEKLRAYDAKIGGRTSQLRKQCLGIVVQTRPDYTTQDDYRRNRHNSRV